MILGSDPEAHGFTTSNSPPRPETEVIHLDFSVDFEVLGEVCGGVSAATLTALNPALLRKVTPPDEKNWPVVVPAGTGQRALAALEKLPEEKRLRWASHRVRKGETLSQIATNYGTSVGAVAEANQLRSVHRLRIGQDLVIPRAGSGGSYASASSARSASSGSSSGSSQKVTYTVRKGDTLSQIAERHRTSVSSLKKWNRVGDVIVPGQKLTLYTGGSAPSSSGKTDYVSVRKGDTLWDIARAHGVSLASLLSANGLTSKSMIRPGDRLRVPRS
jgi:membrane-bound lytic murein transglycosylase D